MASLLGDSDECIDCSGSSSRNRRHQSGSKGGSALACCILFVFLCICAGIVIYMNSDKISFKSGAKHTGGIVLYDQAKSLSKACDTTECKDAVEHIISSLNTSVNPCENFYEYACQGWKANNPRPNYSPVWTVFGKLEKKTNELVSEILSKPESLFLPSDDLPALKHARRFYQDCMGNDTNRLDDVNPKTLETTGLSHEINKNTEIYNVMLKTLNDHGGWPLLQQPGRWTSSKFDLIKAMVAMKTKFASPIFLDVISVQDRAGRLANNSIQIGRPSPTGSLINSLVEEADKHAFKTIIALKDFIVNISKELLLFQGKGNINETYLEDRAWEIIVVESELQSATGKTIDTVIFKLVNGIDPFLVKTNPQQLQNWLDEYTDPYVNSVQIDRYILLLYRSTFYQRLSEPIKVVNIDYVLSVSKLLTELKPEVLANYVMFKMVTTMIPFSTSRMWDHFLKLRHTLDGTTGEKPRKEICTGLTQEKFSLAVGHAYVQQNVFKHFKRINTMFDEIKEVFVDLVDRANIPYFNKIILLVKLKITELCLGYPKILSEESKVENEHFGLYLSQSTFLEKLMAVNSWLTKKQLNTIHQRTDLTDVCHWPRFAGTVGAFSQMQDLLVYLPLGMLQSPFYNIDLPEALNYGTLGSILGHEIIHGLLGPGWLDSKNGTITQFSECLVHQYEKFSTPELLQKNITLDGLQTLRENIPDNAGLTGAYLAYKRQPKKIGKLSTELTKFSEDQFFFLGFAQNWCHSYTPEGFQKSVENDNHGPGMFRVLGTLQNSKEFASAWNCPIGSKMNPAYYEHKKCRFFEA